MIKFFRNIRQRMLSESKFSKYLLYAIGEILLVVIGILIALSINNWNQERINSAKSDELLIGIVKDLGQDITLLNRGVASYRDRLSFFERHMHKSDFSDTPNDTLIKIIDGWAGTIYITAQSFEKAKNLGISQICSDDSLSDRIDFYYTETLEYNKIIVKYDQDETTKENDFWANEYGIELNFPVSVNFPILQDSLERRNNILTSVTTPRGRNHIRMECFRKELILKNYKGILETAEELEADIEAYLNR